MTFRESEVWQQGFVPNVRDNKYDDVKYAEIMFTFMTRSVYWKPFGSENKIL